MYQLSYWNVTPMNAPINRANVIQQSLAKSCGYFVIIMVMNQSASLGIPGSIPGAKTFHRRNPAFFSHKSRSHSFIPHFS